MRADARLGRDVAEHAVGIEPEDRLELFEHLVGRAPGKSILLSDGTDLEIRLDREVRVGHRLGLHALRGSRRAADRAFARVRVSARPRR